MEVDTKAKAIHRKSKGKSFILNINKNGYLMTCYLLFINKFEMHFIVKLSSFVNNHIFELPWI